MRPAIVSRDDLPAVHAAMMLETAAAKEAAETAAAKEAAETREGVVVVVEVEV